MNLYLSLSTVNNSGAPESLHHCSPLTRFAALQPVSEDDGMGLICGHRMMDGITDAEAYIGIFFLLNWPVCNPDLSHTDNVW